MSRWEQLEEKTGEKILYITGGLYMGRRESEVIAGSLGAARQHQLAHELIEHDELAKRYPQFELPADHVGLLEPRAGFLVPEPRVAAYVEDALASGAQIHGQEGVEQWGTGNGCVTVKTNRGTYEANRIIFCGGAWSGKLLSDLGVKLIVTRQVMGWVWPKQPALFELGTLPVWAIDRPGGSIWYGFPMTARQARVSKIALHGKGNETDPDRVDRTTTLEDEETFRSCLRKHIPRARQAGAIDANTRLYTKPDPGFAFYCRRASGESECDSRLRVQRAWV